MKNEMAIPSFILIIFKIIICIKHLTPRSDLYVNSPYIFNTVSSRRVISNEENYQLGDMVLI